MQQKETDIAVKVNDKRIYDRITTWLKDRGFEFLGNEGPEYIWERLAENGDRIKALVVEADSGNLRFVKGEDLVEYLSDWNFLSTAEFKEAIEQVIKRRGLSNQPRSYRLKKDSVEVLAGTIVTWCEAGHYSVVNPELRAFPDDSDMAFTTGSGVCFSPRTVEDQPEWFERVYQLDQYVNEAKYLDIQEQLRNGIN